MRFDYIIIGSGIAGISAAETLRKHDKNATICVISNEPHEPYSKVLLPFYLKGKINFDQLFIRGHDFWQKNNIKFIYGQVSELDPGNKIVSYTDLSVDQTLLSADSNLCLTQNGPIGPFCVKDEISYDKLLIVSGAGAKKLDFPGSDLAGVFYFRNLDETMAIKEYSNTPVYRSEPKPVIYGASFIALEFAGIFAYYGISAKIIFRGPYFWSRLLDRQGGELIEGYLRESGMEIHAQEEIISAAPNTATSVIASPSRRARQAHINKIFTTKTNHDCNFFGLGVGLEPNLDFARQAGLKANQGIITDEFLQTSDPNIFAAGDIAEFYDIIIGRHHVLGNWLNSDMQGRAAAQNMLGAKKAFELVSSYSFTFDPVLDRISNKWFNICAIGDTNPTEQFDIKVFCRNRMYLKLFIKNNQCIGAVLINSPHLRQKLVEFIKTKSNPSFLDKYLNL